MRIRWAFGRLGVPRSLAELLQRLNVTFGDLESSLRAYPGAVESCKVYNAANQTIVNSTVTALTLDSEDHDVGVLHDTVTNNSRITIPAGGDDGRWLFVASVLWNNNVTGLRQARIHKNRGVTGSRIVAESTFAPDATGGAASNNVVAIINEPTVGDFFEVTVQQTSGGGLDVIAGIGNTYFTAVRLL